jgi:hypothetical protein
MAEHHYAQIRADKPYADGHLPVVNIIVVDPEVYIPPNTPSMIYVDLGTPYVPGATFLPVPNGGSYDPTSGTFYRMDDATPVVAQTVPAGAS